jgi:C1A family cysteine protease
MLLCGGSAWGETGNVDGIGEVDLKDAVLALQISAGMPVSSNIDLNADADGDSSIGLAEAVYALQVVADIREALKIWYKDADDDGVSDGTILMSATRPSENYFEASELYAVSGDTDDSNPDIHPYIPPEIDMVQASIGENSSEWVAAPNPVSSLPPEQRKYLLGALLPDPAEKRSLTEFRFKRQARSLPSYFDWRNKNGEDYVTSVKNQGNCGSCWAFAGVATLESQLLISSGNYTDLSEQIPVSCSSAGDCGGGTLSGVSNFLRDTGTASESCYPYTITNGNCGNACSGWQSSAYKIDSWSYVVWAETPTVSVIKNALYESGPLLSAYLVYADFYSYKSGVYSYSWGKYEGGHAIMIVGWDDFTSSFIVKNSWGTYWGDSGYFKIAYSELTGKTEFGRFTLAYHMNHSDPGQLQLNSSAYTVSESGNYATVTVTRSGGDYGTINVNYATSSGTAAAGQDYTAVSGVLTFADGVTSRTFTVSITNDSSMENNETIQVSLSNPTGGAVLGNPASAVISIQDDDISRPGQLQFSSSAYTVNESNASVSITVSRINGSDGAVSVGYSTSSGTAVAGQDYTTASGILNFADGETSKTFSVTVLDDSDVELNESVNLILSGPTDGATLGSPASAVLTITDNDIPQPGQIQFGSSNYSVNEAGGSVTLTVTRSGGSDGSVSVTYATNDGTAAAGSDYTAVSGTITFTDGDTNPKTFSIAIQNDGLIEGSETVNLTLSSPTGGAGLGSPSTAVLTIADDDTPSTYDLYLQNETVSTTETYSSSNSIWAGREVTTQKPYGDYTILSGGNVTLNSGTIYLEPGFTASEGSTFRATAQ